MQVDKDGELKTARKSVAKEAQSSDVEGEGAHLRGL